MLKNICIKPIKSLNQNLHIKVLSNYLSTNENNKENKKSSIFTKMFDSLKQYMKGATLTNAITLLRKCQIQATDPQWFTNGHIDNSFRARNSLLMMHIWIIHKRLIQEGTKRGKLVDECIFDEYWDLSADDIRSEGVHEMSVNKNLKQIQLHQFQFGTELDHALTLSNEYDVLDSMAGSIWRNVYGSKCYIEIPDEHVLEIAKYVRREYDMIKQLPSDSVYFGEFEWGVVPWNSQKEYYKYDPKTNYRNKDYKEKGEWKEAKTPDGKVYYWNTVSRQARWDLPINK